MNNLKICFCGGKPCEPFWYSESDGYIQGDYCYKVVCKKCSTTITGKTKEDAINNWNTNIDKQREKYLTHAHWIINSDGYYPYCSNCKAEPENGKMTKFCAECGAIMDEENENE